MIINHGRIAYDGGLAALVRDVQPRKLVRATFADPVDGLGELERIGVRRSDVDREDDGRVLALEVSRDDLSAVLERLTRIGALLDLEVGDANVEDIIRDLFTRGQAEADAEADVLTGGVR